MLKRKIIPISLIFILCISALTLTACDIFSVFCNHDWEDATCDKPKTCTKCSKTEGEALGHSGGAAGCESKAICDHCGNEYGDVLGHSWVDAGCENPMYCSSCYATVGEPIGHDWQEATCTDPVTCARCSQTEGEALGHEWYDATCTEPMTCGRCNATEGEPNGPMWEEANCTNPKTCTVCFETEGEPVHVWIDANCFEPKTCGRCNATEGEALGHDWHDATCTEPMTCGRCNATEGEPIDHFGGVATCEQRAICDMCGEEYGELDPYNHSGDYIWRKRVSTHQLVYSCCGTEYSEVEEHIIEDGVCTVCGYDPTLIMSSNAVSVYDEFEFDISLSIRDNPGIVGLQIEIIYDENVMMLTQVRQREALSSLVFSSSDSLDSGCIVMFDGVNVSDDEIKDGEILMMTFVPTGNVLSGEHSIFIRVRAYDNDLNPVLFKIYNGTVTLY